MSSRRLLLLGLALAALVLIDLREVLAVRSQRTRLALASIREQRLEAQLRSLRQRRSRLLTGPAPQRGGGAIARPDPAERLARLREVLARHPGARIPEFALLTDGEWMNLAAGPAPLDTEEQQRAKLGQLHDVAVYDFIRRYQAALKAYLAVSGGQLPDNLVAVIPYMDGPVDPSILARYDQVRTGSAALEARPDGGRADTLFMAEKISALPDPAYDSRFRIGVGSWSFGMPIDGPVMQQAQAAYAAANPGRPAPLPDQLQPYFQDPAMGELYVQYERAQGHRLGFPVWVARPR